ncbi:MAG: hypothetical protein AB4290_27135 [Spirulina sp.]
MANVSFDNDIRPLFYQYSGPMQWRFDLTNYDAVKANAALIYQYISLPDPQMPPPPFDPLTKEQVAMFQQWMNDGYPR